ncbi:C40 family peptidase [Pseudomonas sp. F1_0610]|uniref:C40 family peptidase n=1 Tax=Pseudomonas sp. F1_0610 TaxID=3114284 RepID=UPI0039C3B2A8
MLMLKRLASIVPIGLLIALTACTSAQPKKNGFFAREAALSSTGVDSQQLLSIIEDNGQTYNALISYELPGLADSILSAGKELIGTPYRFGGTTTTGFDCSGFVGYLYKNQTGIVLPRTTRAMLAMNATQVKRTELVPGDLILFNKRGRGPVSHVGIYMGNNKFIHSGSRRSGGVRIDSLTNSYWNASYLQAKRVLEKSEAQPILMNMPTASF